MSERPILFSAPMVRAILSGRKTMTRRVLRLPTKSLSGAPIYEHPKMGGWAPTTNGGGGCFTIDKAGQRIPVPETVGIWHQTCGVALDAPYQIGDRLWVREVCQAEELEADNLDGVRYVADGVFRPIENTKEAAEKWLDLFYYGGKRPSGSVGRRVPTIHMPRWASRITLAVTAVRVERLQEITSADAIAEGLAPYANSQTIDCDTPNPRDDFKALWETLHGPGAWDANPWVAVVSFERVTP